MMMMMTHHRRYWLAIAGLFSMVSVSAAAPVTVRFTPTNLTVSAGATFTIDVRAEIPDPVIGWGLDIGFASSVLSLDSFTIGPAWFSTTSADGDDLVGLAFPSAVNGPDVLLGTFTFLPLRAGSTTVAISTTTGDFTEGFALESGGFADVQFGSADVTVVVPEPNSAVSLFIAGLTVFVFRYLGKGSRIGCR